jgi:hypothetical protein
MKIREIYLEESIPENVDSYLKSIYRKADKNFSEKHRALSARDTLDKFVIFAKASSAFWCLIKFPISAKSQI